MANNKFKGLDKAVVAMVCITVLGGIALYRGIDAGLLATLAGIIGGLGGYSVGALKRSRGKR